MSTRGEPPRPFFITPSSSDDHSSQDVENSDSDSPRSYPRPPVAARSRHHRRRSHLGPDVDNSKPPPSSFNFPFQAYPGNPDPIPGLIPTPRRMSLDSIPMTSRSPSINHHFDSHPLPLPPPPPPPDTSPYKSFNGSLSLANLHRASNTTTDPFPRVSSATTIFRSPFLSPASRPSSLWSPPPIPPPSTSPSMVALPLPQKKPLPSTRLKEKPQKPWLAKKRATKRWETASWWVTFLAIVIGIVAAGALCFHNWSTVNLIADNHLCIVMQDDFTGDSLDSDNWSLDVELGGFGSVLPLFSLTIPDFFISNGEFEMTTDSSSNVYLSNGQLYIMPTLSSDTVDGGYSAIMNGGSYQLPNCTASGGQLPLQFTTYHHPNHSTAGVDQGAWVILDRRQNDGTGTGNITQCHVTPLLTSSKHRQLYHNRQQLHNYWQWQFYYHGRQWKLHYHWRIGQLYHHWLKQLNFLQLHWQHLQPMQCRLLHSGGDRHQPCHERPTEHSRQKIDPVWSRRGPFHSNLYHQPG